MEAVVPRASRPSTVVRGPPVPGGPFFCELRRISQGVFAADSTLQALPLLGREFFSTDEQVI